METEWRKEARSEKKSDEKERKPVATGETLRSGEILIYRKGKKTNKTKRKVVELLEQREPKTAGALSGHGRTWAPGGRSWGREKKAHEVRENTWEKKANWKLGSPTRKRRRWESERRVET